MWCKLRIIPLIVSGFSQAVIMHKPSHTALCWALPHAGKTDNIIIYVVTGVSMLIITVCLCWLVCFRRDDEERDYTALA